MKLLNTNLVKISILHFCNEPNVMLSANEVFAAMKRWSVDDVSTDLLSKTLQNMLSNGTLESIEGKFKITPQGINVYEKAIENISSFVTLLERPVEELMNHKEYSIPGFLNRIVAFKTVPYRLDSLDNKSEAEFFKSKIETNQPYRFYGRGLGKSRFSMEHGKNNYCYDDYGILFFNAGLVQYIGFVKRYSNTQKYLYLDSIISLKNPISILDIRNEVRSDFNGSQQKQEIFLQEEVDTMIELLKKKIQFGYDIYERGN